MWSSIRSYALAKKITIIVISTVLGIVLILIIIIILYCRYNKLCKNYKSNRNKNKLHESDIEMQPTTEMNDSGIATSTNPVSSVSVKTENVIEDNMNQDNLEGISKQVTNAVTNSTTDSIIEKHFQVRNDLDNTISSAENGNNLE